MSFCSGCGAAADGAAFCSACGKQLDAQASPAVARSDKGVVAWVLGGLLVLFLVGGVVGAQTGMFPVGSIDGSGVEADLEQHFGQVLGGDVAVTCPDQIPQQKGRITDCSARLPSGRDAEVFVEQIDTGGHYRFQADPTALAADVQDKIERDGAEIQAKIEQDTAAAMAALPRQTFVETCKTGYDEQACGCAYDQMPAGARDTALIELLAMEPSEQTLSALEACGATTD